MFNPSLPVAHTQTCQSCSHNNVCKYKEEFEEGKRIIENEASVYGDMISITISCKYFTSINCATRSCNEA